MSDTEERQLSITNAADVQAYLAMLGEEAQTDDAGDRTSASIDELKLIPWVTYSAQAPEFNIVVGENSVHRAKIMTFAVIDTLASRALWVKDDKELKEQFPAPICNQRFVDPIFFKKEQDQGIGKWLVNSVFDYPISGVEVTAADGTRIDLACNRCPFNQFGSATDWTGKETRGKACRESRDIFVVPISRVGAMPGEEDDMSFFDIKQGFHRSQAEYPFALFPVSMGSNAKFVEALGLAAKGARKPLSAMAFRAEVNVTKIGGNDVAVLTTKVAGLLTPSAFQGHMKPAKTEVHEFAKRNSTAVTVLNSDIPI